MDAITLLCMEQLQPVVFSLANTAGFLLGSRYIWNCENVTSGLGIVLYYLSVWPRVQLHNLVNAMSNKFLPISAMLKFAQRLMSLTAGLLAQNILWVCESFSQCDIALFLHVFKPLISFFYSEVFRAWVWEQKGVTAKSSRVCCGILWNLNCAIWDFLDVILSAYFSCLMSFKFSKTSQLLYIHQH